MPMLLELSRTLPLPGAVWGPYPLRPATLSAPPRRAVEWRSGPARCRAVARAALLHQQGWQQLDTAARTHALQPLRATLRRDGLRGAALAQALGVACAAAGQTLAQVPRDTQRLAAALLLDNRMAEMATGEGKTLAVALAAAVAALAGMPVHVVTANGYLAARDAARMAPLFAALGLDVAALAGDDNESLRRVKYHHDIVYATAKDLAFDFLRDQRSGGAADVLQGIAAALGDGGDDQSRPLMRGLCMALLDEADSILLDEADVPLILSRSAPQAARRAFLWQALALARRLDRTRDFVLHEADRTATLSAAGEEHVAALATGLRGPWQRARYRREAVMLALTALHLMRRNAHYLVRDGAIELLDEVTGRVARGRVWSRGLHTLVALKEGLAAPDETETLAQITFQRFFQRYWRLCGISGTLWEARGELRAVYGALVERIPVHRPCRRAQGATRVFGDASQRFEAVVDRVAALRGAGRPVLIGTDRVEDSVQLSARLEAAGIPHRLLNALHDADEAAIVAAAGRAGQVTVATRMAGRGTDIELDDAARQAGGLHVLSCQHNPSRRLDRQLAGRAGRQGDPGSAENWCIADDSHQLPAPCADTVPWTTLPWFALVPLSWLFAMRRRGSQRLEERRRAAARRHLLAQDLHWERRLAFAGSSGASGSLR